MFDPYSYMSAYYGGFSPSYTGGSWDQYNATLPNTGQYAPSPNAPVLDAAGQAWLNNRPNAPVEQMPTMTDIYDNPTQPETPAVPPTPTTPQTPSSPMANPRQQERFRYLQQQSGRKVQPLNGDLSQRQQTRLNFLQSQGGRPPAIKPQAPIQAGVGATKLAQQGAATAGTLNPRQQARQNYLKKMGR